MKYPIRRLPKIKLILSALFISLLSSNFVAIAADPTPATTLVPNYRDPEIPQVQSLSTSITKTDNQLTVLAELTVKIKSNTLNYIEINLLPKTNSQAINPKLIPPCVKLGGIKAQSNNPGGDMQTLQSRIQSADKWYVEKHVVTTILKLPPVQYPTKVPTFQDLCDGQYVVSTIILKDAAARTLTITANASSTAPVGTTAPNATSNSATQRNRFTDTPIMQTDFWVDGFPMPCSEATNLAPITSTTTVNGRATTTTSVPKSSPTIRSTCNQLLDFNRVYLNITGDSTGTTNSTGTASLPIVDYAGQAKEILNQNKQLTNQVETLSKQVESLQRRISIFQSGGKQPTEENTTGGSLPIVDYKAKADSLQKQLDALNLKLKQLTGKSLSSTKPSPRVTASTKPSVRASSRANTSNRNSNRSTWSNSRNSKNTIKPTSSPTK